LFRDEGRVVDEKEIFRDKDGNGMEDMSGHEKSGV
jgi:hypothetical protein